MRTPPLLELDLAPGQLEREAVESVLDRLATLCEGVDGDRTALFVISPNAGTSTAVQFWGDAKQKGVAFANPALFPWCLANAPCGAIARRLGITGPNATWLGNDDAFEAAWQAAESAMEAGRVSRVLLFYISFGSAPRSAGRLKVWSLSVTSN